MDGLSNCGTGKNFRSRRRSFSSNPPKQHPLFPRFASFVCAPV
jgi:hypothetical protein